MWNKVTILDGGMGTELERLGAEQVNSHRLWSAIVNVNQPEIVVQAHKNFIAAGARIIVANSYQANVPLFMDALSMSREDAEKATLDPILFARQAVAESGLGKAVLVAGSIGPVIDKPGCEYNPEYLKRMSLDEIVDWHHDRFRILVGSECDLLAMETIPGIKEIEALFVLLRRYPKVILMLGNVFELFSRMPISQWSQVHTAPANSTRARLGKRHSRSLRKTNHQR